MSVIQGIDISHWQGIVDFNKVKKSQQFVIIKATEGGIGGYVDPNFITNKNNARIAGLGIGFYHFARPDLGNSAISEANWFCSKVGKPMEGELMVLDYEITADKYKDPVGWCKIFLDQVKKNLNGYRPLLYINLYTAKKYNWKPVTSGNYGLWLAYWDYKPTALSPITQWSVVAMRQYSNKGSVAGINARTDLNVFYGDVNTFKKYGYHRNVTIPTPSVPVIPTLPNTTPTTPPVITPSEKEVYEQKLDTLAKAYTEEVDRLNGKINSLETELDSTNKLLTTSHDDYETLEKASEASYGRLEFLFKDLGIKKDTLEKEKNDEISVLKTKIQDLESIIVSLRKRNDMYNIASVFTLDEAQRYINRDQVNKIKILVSTVLPTVKSILEKLLELGNKLSK